MNLDLLSLKQTVQHNCHIADANAAGDYTLCIYLLKMREFYRWENGYNYGDNIPREDVGNWLREREQLWESLQDQSYAKLPVHNAQYDPFEAKLINQALAPHHLVYGGGLGRNNQAHFFLGVLAKHESLHDYDILVVADEYARDLTAPPAMSQGKIIYLRREALHRLLWEKYEQWLWNRPENAMSRALRFYPFDTDLDRALDDMTNNELNAAILHEIGEVKAHIELGPTWEDLLIQLPHSRLELLLRAVRDHYADTVSTLPALLEEKNEASLHFYIANLTNIRKDLYPGLLNSYESWHMDNNIEPLKKIVRQGARHWADLCQQILEIAEKNPDNFQQPMIELIEQNRI